MILEYAIVIDGAIVSSIYVDDDDIEMENLPSKYEFSLILKALLYNRDIKIKFLGEVKDD